VSISAGDYVAAASGGFAIPVNSGYALPLVDVGRSVPAAASGYTFEGQLDISNVFSVTSGNTIR